MKVIIKISSFLTLLVNPGIIAVRFVHCFAAIGTHLWDHIVLPADR